MTGLPARGERFTDRAGAPYIAVSRQWDDIQREMVVRFRPDPDAPCSRCDGERIVWLPAPGGGGEVPCPVCGTHPSGWGAQ